VSQVVVNTKVSHLDTPPNVMTLVYFGYRFYVPHLGRWLNRDPLQEAGGINLYAYVNGDPLGYVDPDGRFVFVIPALVGVGQVIVDAAAISLAAGMIAEELSEDSGELYESGPKEARKKWKKGQAPCEIDRIDPPHGQPGSQWHVHDKKGGAVNQDGKVKEGNPKFPNKVKEWLRNHGWNI
jgi:RHS repeat-associated protein